MLPLVAEVNQKSFCKSLKKCYVIFMFMFVHLVMSKSRSPVPPPVRWAWIKSRWLKAAEHGCTMLTIHIITNNLIHITPNKKHNCTQQLVLPSTAYIEQHPTEMALYKYCFSCSALEIWPTVWYEHITNLTTWYSNKHKNAQTVDNSIKETDKLS